MLRRVRLVEGARVDFLVRRRGFVLAADSLRQADGPRRPAEGIAQLTFDFIGPVASARPGPQNVHALVRSGPAEPRANDVLVQLVPAVGQLRRQVWQDDLELRGGDFIRQWPPTALSWFGSPGYAHDALRSCHGSMANRALPSDSVAGDRQREKTVAELPASRTTCGISFVAAARQEHEWRNELYRHRSRSAASAVAWAAAGLCTLFRHV